MDREPGQSRTSPIIQVPCLKHTKAHIVCWGYRSVGKKTIKGEVESDPKSHLNL